LPVGAAGAASALVAPEELPSVEMGGKVLPLLQRKGGARVSVVRRALLRQLVASTVVVDLPGGMETVVLVVQPH
jgi:hypothetical protein